jgi:hypothetical protein
MDEPSIGMVIWKNRRPPIQLRQRLKGGFEVGDNGRSLRIGASTLSWDQEHSVTMTITSELLHGVARFDTGEDLPLNAPPSNGPAVEMVCIARRRFVAMISLGSAKGAIDPVEFEGEAEYEHLVGLTMDPGLGGLGWGLDVD